MRTLGMMQIGGLLAALALAGCKGPSVTVTDPETGEKTKVSISKQASGENALQITAADGTAVVAGAGASVPKDLPGWVKMYPGLKLVSVMSGAGAQGAGGMLIGETGDSVEKVAAFYRGMLDEGGFTASRVEMQTEGTVSLGGSRGKEGLFVAASPTDGGASVTITYSSK
jgi:hypothetical protein